MEASPCSVDQSAYPTGPLIIIGAGHAGCHLASEIMKRDDNHEIKIFCDEHLPPYDRVQLPLILEKQASFADIQIAEFLKKAKKVSLYSGTKIRNINPMRMSVTTQDGVSHFYRSLFLATGSSPIIPLIPGNKLQGVLSFRTYDDALNLRQRVLETERITIIGGGALAVETAAALAMAGQTVTLVFRSRQLLSGYFNDTASELIANHLIELGVTLHAETIIASIEGDAEVRGVRFSDGRTLETDTVVFCTGVQPNIALAKAAGIKTRHGICIDHSSRTSAPNIFAGGDCAEHDGRLYTLARAGIEHARAAARAMFGEEGQLEKVHAPGLKLKVPMLPCFSLNSTALESKELIIYCWQNQNRKLYRCLTLCRDIPVSVQCVGKWPELGLIEQAIRSGERLDDHSVQHFVRTGEWTSQTCRISKFPPADELVCHCRSVTWNEISHAVRNGATSLKDIQNKTGASTGCGSCSIAIASALNAPHTTPTRQSIISTRLASMTSLLICLSYMAVPIQDFTMSNFIPLATKIPNLDINSSTTGYGLLTLTLCLSLIGLRKRLSNFSLGTFANWRLSHAIIALLGLIVFSLHTDFKLHANLNAALYLFYTMTMCLGAISGSLLDYNGPFFGWARNILISLHGIIFIPLLFTIIFHVFVVFYF
ncbi:FAD-dependent oxidoreductase [Alcanivorax sp.]|uniref:FAD-dependent oxidoreductase n=1 Tax=Alcanivorax sp. TaxID=1872427 RepID=UPI002B274875|nr:FAD-dependent oxidoreductase [Alcanivorax sp.]